MRKLSRWILVALAAVTLAGSAAQALTYTVTSISAGSGYACADLACSGGAILTLSPTPQGSLGAGTNTVDVVGSAITGINTVVSGPLNFSPSGSVASLSLNPSLYPAQTLTSSSCATVVSTVYCGATLRFNTTALGFGTNYLFMTFNLQAVPEPSLAALFTAAALFGIVRLRRA